MSVSESTQLRFTPLEANHLARVLDIEREAYPEPWSEGMFREEIHHARSRFVVAMLGSELIGYGGYWPLLDEAHITSVTIRDDYRRQGYGRMLFAYLLERAVEDGSLTATLEVRESNLRARALYEAFGLEVVGRRKKYYPKTDEDALIMTKRLES